MSTNGSDLPRWRADGKELYYVSALPTPTLMAAAVSARGTTFDVGAVTPLFRVVAPGTPGSFYQPSPDGKQFLVNMAPVNTTPTPITVVVNWTAGLKK